MTGIHLVDSKRKKTQNKNNEREEGTLFGCSSFPLFGMLGSIRPLCAARTMRLFMCLWWFTLSVVGIYHIFKLWIFQKGMLRCAMATTANPSTSPCGFKLVAIQIAKHIQSIFVSVRNELNVRTENCKLNAENDQRPMMARLDGGRCGEQFTCFFFRLKCGNFISFEMVAASKWIRAREATIRPTCVRKIARCRCLVTHRRPLVYYGTLIGHWIPHMSEFTHLLYMDNSCASLATAWGLGVSPPHINSHNFISSDSHTHITCSFIDLFFDVVPTIDCDSTGNTSKR